MSYLEKLNRKISLLEELPKVPKGIETENKPTPPTAKSAKTPFDSFGSTPGSRFCGIKIEPMTICLHGKVCKHLDAPGTQRPVCSKAGNPLFDLTACPLGKWWY